jgi:exonuclease VII large subunit
VSRFDDTPSTSSTKPDEAGVGSDVGAKDPQAAAEAPPPAEELRKALEHLGRAASSLRDRYLSDEKVNAATERARLEAEHVTEGVERVLRKAVGVLDELAVDAEKSITQVAREAEKTLRDAQKSAAPVLERGLSWLTAVLEGKSDSTASTAEDGEAKPTSSHGDDAPPDDGRKT